MSKPYHKMKGNPTSGETEVYGINLSLIVQTLEINPVFFSSEKAKHRSP